MSGFGTGGFGQPSSGFGSGGGGFGQPQPPQPPGFGGQPPAGLGQPQQQQPSAFGQQQPPQPSFGSPAPAAGFVNASSGGFGSASGGFGAPAPAPAAFGASSPPAFGSSTGGFAGGGFASSAPAPAFGTSTSSASGFGAPSQPQQAVFGSPPPQLAFGQQSQPSSGFGQPSASPSQPSGFGQPSQPSTGFGSGSPSQPSTGMVFGSSSNVVAQPPSATGATAGFAPASSAFGSAPAAGGFGSPANVPASSGFGSAAPSSGFSSPAPPPATGFGSSAGGFGSSSQAPAPSGFGSSSASGGFGLSASAAPFAPDKSLGGGGFSGGSSTGFGSSMNDDNAPAAASGFGSSSGGFGGVSSTPSTSTSSPFAQRIPRKEKSSRADNSMGADNNEGMGSSEAAGNDQLAALKARIQEKRKKLQQMKQGEQSSSSSNEARDRKKDDESANADLAARNALRFAKDKKKDDESANAELAAKNALRFSTSDRDQSLNKLLPKDLKAKSGQFSAAAAPSSDDAGGGWSTPDQSGDDDEDDMGGRNHLSNAKSLIGVCMSMCPDEELVRREREGDIQLLEITDPGGLHPKEWTLRDTAVKRFRRSAADFKLDIPELVRPPEVLERVCGYLEEWVMERDRQGPDKRWMQSTQPSDTPPALDVYQFIWDRTRMVRKDFILQNHIGDGGKCDARAVRCHERIARWHAMSEHQLSHIPDFVKHQSQQNVAELGQTMKTLNNYYDDALGRSLIEEGGAAVNDCAQGCGSDIVMGKSPVDFDGNALSNTAQAADVAQRIIGSNGAKFPSRGTAEPEMRGLYILLTLNNEGGMEVLKYSGRLCVQKPAVFYSKPVQLALAIFQAKKDHNYAKFFSLLRSPSTPYLFACVMFKYVESTRKDALTIMSKTYGARHKTTGEAYYDAYPLNNLVNLLCYEDEEEARTACQHYGLTVEGDKVFWRRSRFREPRDPEKGHILHLKPRKMIRTIEAKLNGATRLSVCRGGVSGEGATLAASPGSDAAAAEEQRNKAREAAEKARQDLAKKRLEEEAKARAQTEKQEKERLVQEQLAAEKRAKVEAAKRAEMERLEKERVERERILAEQQRKEEEARRLAEAKAAAEQAERERREREAREREAARKKAEEERKEEERQRLLAKQREEEARRQAEIKAAQEAADKKRREEEERRRQEELRRKAEEERVRKAREEEARRVEMAWREKIERARKVLAFRLWRKQMQRRESLQQSQQCLESLDPTATSYPSPLPMAAAMITTSQDRPDGSIVLRNAVDEEGLENQMYRLATSSRSPMNLSRMVAECLIKSPNPAISYPPTVQSSQHTTLFKLAVLLPERTSDDDALYDTLRMWVNSRLSIGQVSSYIFENHSHQIVEVRSVVVVGNEDSAGCKDCNAALFLLPSTDGNSSRRGFPTDAVEELLKNDVSRMVLILGNGESGGVNHMAETTLDHLVGKAVESDGAYRRPGVAAPAMCHLDAALEKCCGAVASSYIESMQDTTAQLNRHVCPLMARLSLETLGCLCLQRLIQNVEAAGYLRGGCLEAFASFEDPFFTSRENALTVAVCISSLERLVAELAANSEDVRETMQNWPPLEFLGARTNATPKFFHGRNDLPSNWNRMPPGLGQQLSDIFLPLLEQDSFEQSMERFARELAPALKQQLLTFLDNGEYSSCFASVVSLLANGELSMGNNNEGAALYLPVESLSNIIERAAAFEAPQAPEPAEPDIPSYLFGTTTVATVEEEKENSRSDNAALTPEVERGVVKRKPEVVEPDTSDNARAKRIRSSAPVEETEEQRKSSQFTSFLEALLG